MRGYSTRANTYVSPYACSEYPPPPPVMCPGIALWLGVTSLGHHVCARSDLCSSFELKVTIPCAALVMEVICSTC